MKLTFNPYTYVRVAVMRTLLLKPEDYHKLLKMSFPEIAEALRQSTYKKEIEERALRRSGADLLEHALNANLKKSYAKLLRIADEPLHQLIDAFLFRNDVWNLKTILRAKATGMPDEEVKEMLLPGSIQDIAKIMRLDSTAKVLHESGLFSQTFAERLAKLDLIALENELDRAYFKRMGDFASRIEEGDVIREFLQNELDVANITSILKLKRFGLSPQRIREFVILDGPRRRLMNRLVEAKGVDEVIENLKGTPYYAVLKNVKGHDMLFAEAQMRRFLLKRAIRLLHQNLLTVDIILAYMLSKEIEIMNLKRIIKGKQLGMDEERIESVLVT